MNLYLSYYQAWIFRYLVFLWQSFLYVKFTGYRFGLGKVYCVQFMAIAPQLSFRSVLNVQFLSLLQSGIDVRTAYEVIHKDEMIQGALQFGAKRAEERVANAVQAGQRRPAEGAMAPRATTTRKTDVTQLTRADRDEIERRVARGEKIRF